MYGKNSGQKETGPSPITRQYIPCSAHTRETSLSPALRVEYRPFVLMENRYDINMFYCVVLQSNRHCNTVE